MMMASTLSEGRYYVDNIFYIAFGYYSIRAMISTTAENGKRNKEFTKLYIVVRILLLYR